MKETLSLVAKVREKGNNFIINRLKDFGYKNLAPSHGDILVVLYKENHLTMKDIALKICKTKATVTVLIDKLEKLELIKREKSLEDSRSTNIVLTQKGKDLEPIFQKISNELDDYLHKNLTNDESIQLDFLLKKIL
jgi:DNA-binding MarR family transcriptional regulator